MLLLYPGHVLFVLLFLCFFFFFKQKTAYEMRISDWSSDVCSSDLYWQRATYHVIRDYNRVQLREELRQVHQQLLSEPAHRTFANKIKEIGRASCRERVCQYV